MYSCIQSRWHINIIMTQISDKKLLSDSSKIFPTKIIANVVPATVSSKFSQCQFINIFLHQKFMLYGFSLNIYTYVSCIYIILYICYSYTPVREQYIILGTIQVQGGAEDAGNTIVQVSQLFVALVACFT